MASYLPPEDLRVGNGTETVFGFTFPYLRATDIALTVNGVATPVVLVGTAQLSINPAPALGTAIRIYRDTPAQFPKYLFATGVPMLPKYIDENNRQLLYALQEGLLAFDSVADLSQEALDAAREAVEASAAALALVTNVTNRALRVPATEPGVSPLPPVETRRGTLLGFNNVGQPVSVLPGPSSVEDVMLRLAGTDGSSFIGHGPRTVSDRLEDVVHVLDFVEPPLSDTTKHQAGMEAALAAARFTGKVLYWPVMLESTAPLADLHLVRHAGPGGVTVAGTQFYVDPSPTQANVLYMAPGGTGDGLTAARPLAGFNAVLSVLHQHAPLQARWSVVGSAGTYNEGVVVPDFLATGRNYLSWTFPATAGDRTNPASYPAKLDGTGLSSLQGFLSGAGNRMSVTNLAVTNWYDPAFGATSQVRRGITVSTGAFLYLVNCAGVGNGLSNAATLPGATAIITGGVYEGARYGLDNTAGRMSLSASATTYSVIRGALEYGLYAKHEGSTVMDYTEFSDCGRHQAAVSYGAAIFAYKSNTSVDTRGCKYYRNNIVHNLRGGFVADNPGIPDVYGTGADANLRRYLVRGGGADDISTYAANSVMDITSRVGGGSTTNTTDTVLLTAIASTREGYLANNDQCLRLQITARAITAAGLITPVLRHSGGFVTLGTYRIAAGQFAEIRLNVRPTTARTAMQVTFTCIGAVQNLGLAVGQVITSTLPLTTEALTVEVQGRAEAGGTCTLISCNVDMSG